MADKKTLELQIKLAAEQAARQIKLFADDIKTVTENTKGLSINQDSVTAKVKSLQTEANRAANSLKLFGGSTSELRNQQSKMKQTVLDLIDHGLKPESVEVQNLVQQYKKFDDELSKTEAKQDGLFGVINKLKNEMGSLATVAAAVAVDKAITDFSKSALAVSDSFRGAKEEFGIMLGDMQAGAGLFDELQEFNFWTPFDIEQTSQAAKVLMAAKVPLGEITDYLTRFGDIAQGDGQKFQSFINAFSKASAKGKADMEVLNVYIDQGVQILDALAQQMGITTAEVVDFSSKGKISFEQFDQALASLAAEGGLYYNSMATAAMRLSSVQAGLEESVKSLKASIGDMLAPVVAKVLELFTNIVDKINSSPILKGILLGAITALTVAVNAFALKALAALVVQTHAGTVALTALGTAAHAMLGPIGLVTLAIGAVVGVVATMASEQQKANEEANAAALALKKQAQGYDELKAAAQNYMTYMNNMSLAEAEAELKRYTDVILPNYTKSVELAKKKLSSTPKYLELEGFNVGVGLDESNLNFENPEWLKAKKNLEEAEAELAKFTAQADIAKNKIENLRNTMAENLVAFGTEWQDKLASETAGIDEQQKKSLEALNARAKELLGENFQDNEAYRKELDALNTFYDNKRKEQLEKDAEEERKRLEELVKKIETSRTAIESWLNKNADSLAQIELERSKERLKLEKEIQFLKNQGLENEELFMKSEKELELYYDRLIAETRQKLAEQYWQNMAKKAAEQQNWSLYAGANAVVQNQSTDLGQILQAIQSGKSVFEVLINIIIKCVSELESFQKAMNIITEIIKKVFTRLEPMLKKATDILDGIIDDLAELLVPIVAIIISVCNEITKSIAPLINAIKQDLQPLLGILIKLFNDVIVPLANGLVWFTNIIIDIINTLGFIFGIHLQHLQNWDKIELLSEEQLDNTKKLTEAQEKALNQVRKQYERMEDAVKSQLNSQLEALKSQYELGLISRSEYEKQAEKYASVADNKLYEIEKEMNEKLAAIENNTGDTANNIKASIQKVSGLENFNPSDHLMAEPSFDDSNLQPYFDTVERAENITASSSSGAAAASALKSISQNDYWKLLPELARHFSDYFNQIPSMQPFISGAQNGTLTEQQKKAVNNYIPMFFQNFPAAYVDALQNWHGFGTWDVGSSNIPHDQFGMVHKGEIIVPRKFSDGIRSGELSLSRERKSSQIFNVTVNVQGSVMAERELVTCVYEGMAKAIQNRSLTPLPAGGF